MIASKLLVKYHPNVVPTWAEEKRASFSALREPVDKEALKEKVRMLKT